MPLLSPKDLPGNEQGEADESLTCLSGDTGAPGRHRAQHMQGPWVGPQAWPGVGTAAPG